MLAPILGHRELARAILVKQVLHHGTCGIITHIRCQRAEQWPSMQISLLPAMASLSDLQAASVL